MSSVSPFIPYTANGDSGLPSVPLMHSASLHQTSLSMLTPLSETHSTQSPSVQSSYVSSNTSILKILGYITFPCFMPFCFLQCFFVVGIPVSIYTCEQSFNMHFPCWKRVFSVMQGANTLHKGAQYHKTCLYCGHLCL